MCRGRVANVVSAGGAGGRYEEGNGGQRKQKIGHENRDVAKEGKRVV